MVRADKFVEQYGSIIKSWVTWVMRAIYPGDPPWAVGRGSNPDTYVAGRGEFRGSQGLLASQNHERVLGAGSAPATNMRQNWPQMSSRTHTTNSPHQGTMDHGNIG